jgi:hypothetical protein
MRGFCRAGVGSSKILLNCGSLMCPSSSAEANQRHRRRPRKRCGLRMPR